MALAPTTSYKGWRIQTMENIPSPKQMGDRAHVLHQELFSLLFACSVPGSFTPRSEQSAQCQPPWQDQWLVPCSHSFINRDAAAMSRPESQVKSISSCSVFLSYHHSFLRIPSSIYPLLRIPSISKGLVKVLFEVHGSCHTFSWDVIIDHVSYPSLSQWK